MSANGTQELLGGFSGILADDSLPSPRRVGRQGGRINFLQQIAGGLAVSRLLVRRKHNQLCLRRFEQNAGVADAAGSQGVKSGAAQYFPQEGTHVGRIVNAKNGRPGVADFFEEGE